MGGIYLVMTQMRFDSLNFGNKFYAKYDRRHDISWWEHTKSTTI